MTEHVKVYGVKPRIQYTADGELTSYDFPFAIFKSSDIEAYLGDTKQASNTYTVSGVGDSEGGSVTFNEAPASGTVITLVRNLSIERTSDFQEGSTLRAKVLNDELDYQMACTQQIAENLNRSMVLPPYATDNDLDLTLPVPSAGKAIVWNSDGTNLENSTVAVNDLESTLKSYKESAESAASTSTTKAGIASDAATTATTQAGIATSKAAEAASTLASKANKDMDNLSTAGKGNLVGFNIPDYSSGISVTYPTSSSPFVAPKKGILVVWIVIASSYNRVLYINGSPSAFTINNTSGYQDNSSITVPLDAGDSVYFDQESGTTQTLVFYPFKGVV